MFSVVPVGFVISIRDIPPYLVESTENALSDVLKNATPPWSVSIQGSQASSNWTVTATPEGGPPFEGVLSDGEHSYDHVRALVQGFLTEFETEPH